MTTADLLQRLAERDIRLTRKGEQLGVNAPEGTITPELRKEIVLHKDEILALLAQPHELVLEHKPDTETAALSFAQQRLWFLHQLNPKDPSYNLAFSKRFTSSPDLNALQKSVNALVKYHQSLSTIFPEKDGVPYQVVTDRSPQIVVTEISPADATPERLRQIQYAETRKIFDLANEPPARVNVFKLPNDEWIVLFSTHHIISDAWSLGLLASHLTTLYEVFKGRTLPDDAESHPETILGKQAYHYTDFAYSEQKWFESNNQQSHAEYWKSVVRHPLPTLDLPTKSVTSADGEIRGESFQFYLPAQVSEGLRALARQSNSTLYSVVLALFKTILHRYSGQSDILIGTPVSNRNKIELESIVGILINTIVLRTSFSADATFAGIVRQIHNHLLDAHEHRDYPFEKIVDLARPDRSLSQSALIRTAFILNNTPDTGHYESFTGGTIFDISLYLDETPEGLKGTLEYNSDLFEQDTVERMAGHYIALAESALSNPESQISKLSLFTEEERATILDEWNDTKTSFPAEKKVNNLFEEQAAANPDRVAVRAAALPSEAIDTSPITYQELDRRANMLAHHLIRKGVVADSLVGICLDRSPEMLVATLAVWKAGGAYVPLDPAYPQERLAYMAEDAVLTALITEEQYEHTVPGISCPVIYVDHDRDAIAAEPNTKPQISESSRHLAYVIYTSGSTGKPKGVLIEHRSVVNLLCHMREEPGLTQDDVLFSVTTLSFDISALELYLPIISGAQVVIASRDILSDPRQLAQAIRDYKSTVIQATPATWRFLLDAGWNDGKGLKILCGGEALPRNLANAIISTGAELWNVYGPTETTIWSTTQKIEYGDEPVSVGRPINNTTTYILDENLNPVPVSVPGELYIGGKGLARGYHNQPALTESVFVHDPFSPDKAARMYKTGDQVRYKPDGGIEYLGRLDNQVKVRGYRIELGEIESRLNEHEEIRHAVVAAREDTPGDQRLVAYVIENNGKGPSQATYRAFLLERLPSFMVPSAFVKLTEFPLTPNGKVNRRALPPPPTSVTDKEEKVDSTRMSPLETTIVSVWEDVLGIKGIGRNDNFFDLGGNSLLGIKLLSGVEKAIGRRVPVAVIFQGQTVATMASALESDIAVDSDLRAVAVQPKGTKTAIFFVPGVNGNVIGYEDFAKGLGDDQPLYGLRSVGLEGEAEPLTDLPSIAEHFIEDIKRIQPVGPYRLIGFCIGGMVALEIAQQLKRQGEKTEMLGLIDTWPQDMVPVQTLTSKKGQQVLHLWNSLKRNVQEIQGLPIKEWPQHLRSKLTAVSEIAKTGDVYRGDDGERHQNLVIASNQTAASGYKALPYDGPLSLLITLGKSTLPNYQDPRLYWKGFGQGKTTVTWIPGLDSGSLLRDPYLPGLIKAINELVEHTDSL